MRAAHPGKRVLTYYQDEARFYQDEARFYQDEARFGHPRGHGTLSRVWARVGSRPRAIRQTQYDYLYVLAAVCPQTGDTCGLRSPHLNTGVMNAFLAQFASELPQDVHAVMVLDRAGNLKPISKRARRTPHARVW